MKRKKPCADVAYGENWSTFPSPLFWPSKKKSDDTEEFVIYIACGQKEPFMAFCQPYCVQSVLEV